MPRPFAGTAARLGRGLAAAVAALLLPALPAVAATGATVVDCDAALSDIAAVQGAVDAAPDGGTVRLRGTCDFSAAPPHGGDASSIEAAAVAIRPGGPVNGLLIEADGDPATIAGSGTQTAFFVGPNASGVTIRGLRFVNLARPIVVLNATATTIGSAVAAAGNRFFGGASMNAAVLAVADDAGGGPLTVAYGDAAAPSTWTAPAGGALRAFTVAGNTIEYRAPGVPEDGVRDLVGVDVSQRNGGAAEAIAIERNTIALHTTELPLFAMSGVRVRGRAAGATPRIRDVTIADNTVGRAGDLPAGGHAGIVLAGVGGARISGNVVHARLSAAGMPGGGIVVADSADATVTENSVSVVTDPAAAESGLGGIGVVEDLGTLAGEAAGPRTERILVRGNTVVSASPAGAAGRGILLNGVTHASVVDNAVEAPGGRALSLGGAVRGPERILDGPVTGTVACRNMLDGAGDHPGATEFRKGAGSTGNAFPLGRTYAGNMGCTAEVLAPASISGGTALTVSGRAWPARPLEATLTGPGGEPLARTGTAGASGAYAVTFTSEDLAAFTPGTMTVSVAGIDDLSPVRATAASAEVELGGAPFVPYDNDARDAVELPDHMQILPFGSFGGARASAAASRTTGRVFASAAAFEALPAGVNLFGVGAGSSSALANGRVIQSFSVEGGGEYVVTMTIASLRSSASGAGAAAPYAAGPYAQTFAGMSVGYRCTQPGCTTTRAASASVETSCWPARASCSWSSPLRVSATVTVPPGEAGTIGVEGGVFAHAVVWGAASASASIGGLVSSITAAKA